MKKTTAIIMTASLLLLSGCGSNGGERVIEGDVQTIESDNAQTQETNTSVSDTGSADVKEDTQTESTQAQAAEKGYVFSYNGVSVIIDAEAASIIDALGEPVSYFEAASCAFEGLDKMYTYNGFELDTYPTNDADYVSSLIIKDDSVSTAEGVCIGDSREKMQQAYGDGEESGGMTVYAKDGMKLCFILQEDEIVSIEYRSTVLEENVAGAGN
ncbi:MAG: hypothetical protein NC313_01015 [Butyrivibrio sp.]|nr:hypothetical protein [Butyrivibrio sp.]